MRIGFAIFLAAAFVSMLVAAYSQEKTEQPVQYKTVTQYETVPQPQTEVADTSEEKELPRSGGLAVGTVFLPSAALLLGSGVLMIAVMRRALLAKKD